MGIKIFCCIWISLCVMVIFIQVEKTHSRRSNGGIKRCGNEQRHFLKWFCKDPTFDYPFPFNKPHLVRMYRAPNKKLYPFQHQAAKCCRRGCSQIGYQRMCRYHQLYKRCLKIKNYPQRLGRKTRLILSFCSRTRVRAQVG